MTQKILIIGSGIGTNTLVVQNLREQYGYDIDLVTPEEAKERGLQPKDFGNLPKLELTAPPKMEDFQALGLIPSGKEKRRQRRAQERKTKKNNQTRKP